MKDWWSRAARDSVAALVVSLAAVSFYLSAASLLFQGPLAAYLPVAIGSAMAGGVVLSLFAAWKGSLPLASAGPEPATVPVLAALCAGTASQVTGPALLPTVLAALAVTAVAVGAVWWLMGVRRWGDLVRYIPYPVIGGFLGSVGWLMVTGGLGVAAGQGFTFAHAAQWVAQADPRVAAGVAIGVLLWWGTLRIRHLLTLPVLLVLFALLLHGGFWWAGLDVEAARDQGWLLPALGRTLPMATTPALLADADWLAVLREAGLIASVVIVATIGLLLSDSSLEVAWDERADLNLDLRVLGPGNVAAGAAGALLGGISISRSVLNKAAGAAGRGTSLALALICTAVMVWGGPAVGLVPRALLGGLLVYLGIGLLKAWLLDARPRLAPTDYLTVAGMVIVTAVAGFLAAVCVGVLACCLDFAVAWARLVPVRRLVSRNDWPSHDERSPQQTDHLQQQGLRWRIVELQGALFFGSATALVERVQPLLEGDAPPERLLFDFRHVRWLDSSGAQALGRLFKLAQKAGTAVHLSALPPAGEQALRGAGALAPATPLLHADIDAAVRAWDDDALQAAGIAAPSLEAALAPLLGPEAAARLLAAFEPVALAAGEWLFHQGDASDALYLVQSGRLAALVVQGDAEIAVRTSGPGSTIGEMGLFRSRHRSAGVRAEQPSVVLRLAQARLAELEAQQPALASALYRFFVLQLAGRLEQSTAQAAALAR